MSQVLDALRIHLASRPLLMAIPTALALLCFLRRTESREPSWIEWTEHVVAGAAMLAFIVVAGYYLAYPSYYDHAEPTIAAVAWRYWVDGVPLYHSVDAAARYTHVYGPALFLVQGAALAVLGPSILASKIPGVTAALLSLVILGWVCGRQGGRSAALLAVGSSALLLLAFRNMGFWNRPEPLLFLSVVAALCGARVRSALPGIALFAVGVSLGTNLKITAAGYFLPIAVLFARRWGIGRLLCGAALALALTAAPFFMPGIDFARYLEWLSRSGGNGLSLWTLRLNLEWALFLAVPLLATLYCRRGTVSRGDLALLAASVLGVVGVAVTAAKPGAWHYHMLPFYPLFCYLACASAAPRERRGSGVVAVELAFSICLALVVISQQAYFLADLQPTRARALRDDLQRIIDERGGSALAVGYAGNYRLSLLRPLAVFAGGPYPLDAPAIMEHQLSGLELPSATIDAVRHCGVNTWVVPRDGTPFAAANFYAQTGHRDLFAGEFRAAFYTAYEPAGTSRFYSLWSCRRRPS